jgi:hypothetical protein
MSEIQYRVIPVHLENTKTTTINPLAKTIAMLVPTLTPTKPRVSFVRKVNIRTKTIKSLAKHVVLGNTMIKLDKLPNRLLVKVAPQENSKTTREKHPATKIVRVPW